MLHPSIPFALQQPAWQFLARRAEAHTVPSSLLPSDIYAVSSARELVTGISLRSPDAPYSTRQQMDDDSDALQEQRFPPTDHDGHWKDALQEWLQPCIALFWPDLHGLIDWQVPPVFLNKELSRIGGSLYRDRRYVDVLAELRIAQRATLLLLHTEVQARMDNRFARRLYHYFTRLQDRYPDHDILQFAIVTQESNFGKNRRIAYSYEPLNGSFLRLHYSTPVINLQDWKGKEDALHDMAASNPFALILLAELHAKSFPMGGEQRLRQKIGLVRELYRYRYTKTEVQQLFLFIDATMRLSSKQTPEFSQALATIEQEQKVAYISSVERYWRKTSMKEGREQGWKQGLMEGRQEGLQEGLQEGRQEGMHLSLSHALYTLLEQRFGPLSENDQQRLQHAQLSELEQWMPRVLKAGSLHDVWVAT